MNTVQLAFKTSGATLPAEAIADARRAQLRRIVRALGTDKVRACLADPETREMLRETFGFVDVAA